MSGLQRLVGWLSTLQLCVLFAILMLRGHHRRVPLFTLYVGGLALTDVIVGLVYTWETWMIRQVAVAALRFGVALELSYAIFGAFPAAAATARRVFLALLVMTALAAMAVSGPDVTYQRFNAEMIPRLATGTVWILTALAALVLWYRLPLRSLQKAILVGLAPYLLVFTVGLNLLSSIGWHLRAEVGYANTLALFVVVNYWCRVAWRTAVEATTYPSAAQVPEQVS
jgi:hypothetical protein